MKKNEVKNKNKKDIKITSEEKDITIKITKSKLKKIFTIVCLIILAIIFIGFSAYLIINNKEKILKNPLKQKIEYPYIYSTNDGNIKYISSKLQEAATIGISDDDSYTYTYANTTSSHFLLYNDSTLYLVDTKSEEPKTKIATDVIEYDFSQDDKYILYIDKDLNLYNYDYKEKEKLDSDVKSIVEVTKDKIYYNRNDILYVRSINSSIDDREKITDNFYNAFLNKDNTKILYSKTLKDENNSSYEEENNIYHYNEFLLDYYVYDIETKDSEKVLSNVERLYDYNKEFTKFIYTKNRDEYKIDFANYVNDDKYYEDKNFKEYDYDDYWEDRITYEEYSKNREQSYIVDKRNDLRKELGEYDYSLTQVEDLYFKINEDNIKIDSNIYSVVDTDINNMSVVYATISYDNNGKKVNLSELNYASELEDNIRSFSKVQLKVKINDLEIKPLTSDKNSYKNVVINEEGIYFENDKDLYFSKVNKDNIEDAILIAEDSVIAYRRFYNKGVLYLKNYNEDKSSGDLYYIKDGESIYIDDNVLLYSFEIKNSNKLYYYKNYEDYSGKLMLYDGKESHKIADNVLTFRYVKDNYIYILKNYSSTTHLTDLYIYKGNEKLTEVDYGVRMYIREDY